MMNWFKWCDSPVAAVSPRRLHEGQKEPAPAVKGRNIVTIHPSLHMSNILSTLFLLIFFVMECHTASTEQFSCTEVVGVSVTTDWFMAGFKEMVGSDNWQLRAQEHAYIELWSNVKSSLWTMNAVSTCPKKTKPDRVLFTAVNWEYKTTEEWETSLLAVIKAIKERHYTVKSIELLTMLRGPKNKSCGDDKTIVDEKIDLAIQSMVTAHQGLVVAGPKVEAPSCAVFLKGGPHLTEKVRSIL